jgi:hypothetical protein
VSRETKAAFARYRAALRRQIEEIEMAKSKQHHSQATVKNASAIKQQVSRLDANTRNRSSGKAADAREGTATGQLKAALGAVATGSKGTRYTH